MPLAVAGAMTVQRKLSLVSIATSALMVAACTPPRGPVSRGPLSRGSHPTSGTVPLAAWDISEVSYSREKGFPGAVVIPFASRPASLFDRPWPSVLDRTEEGALDLSRIPLLDHPLLRPILREAAPLLVGPSVAPAILVPVVGSLPDSTIEAAIRSGAIGLINVDPSSPLRGSTHALKHHVFRGAEHVPDGTIGLRPHEVLAPETTYALVVQRDLGATLLGTDDEFEDLKATQPHDEPSREAQRRLHQPLFRFLEARGLHREAVAAVALFRTQPAFEPMASLLAAVDQLPGKHQPRLLEASWSPSLERPSYRVVEGYYCTPSFQSRLEHAPFANRGGLLERDQRGRPKPHELTASNPYAVRDCGPNLRAKFVLTVPKAPLPAHGWPLAVYAHGTTGDAQSGLEFFAGPATRAGVAVVATDQPLHGSGDPKGARPGSDLPLRLMLGPWPIPMPTRGRGGELAFYNVARPGVLRANQLQAVADSALLGRLILATDFRVAIRSDGSPLLSASHPRPRFSSDEGYIAAGHSQGTQTAAALGAFDPLARATYLSAAGGDFAASLLARPDTQQHLSIAQLVLGVAPDELNEFHPLISLVQTLIDPIDPRTFALRLRRRQDHSVLLVSGVGDTKMVNAAGGELTRALRLQPIGSLPLPIEGLPELGIHPAAVVHGNGPHGSCTRALLQLNPSYAYDGHYVAYREPAAGAVLEQFLRALARGDTAPRLTRHLQGTHMTP